MKRISLCLTAALALAAVGAAAPELSAADDPEKVTIVGCAIKGDGDGDGFLLANAVDQTRETTTMTGPAGTSTTSSVTTTLRPSRLIYWLDDDDDVVEKHMGHQVEIVGEVEGDIEEGEIEIEREEGIVELEIDADGREATVRIPYVPSAVGTSGTAQDDEQELKFVVRKLDVQSVRMIAPTCQ